MIGSIFTLLVKKKKKNLLTLSTHPKGVCLPVTFVRGIQAYVERPVHYLFSLYSR